MKKVMLSEIFGDSTTRENYHDVAQKWIAENCHLYSTYDVGINQIDDEMCMCMRGDSIIIEVDSNTPLAINKLAVLLVVCASNGIKVELDCGDGLVQQIL